MKPIEVTAQFNAEGQITPISFHDQGQFFSIESIGRRWADGESEHILVMTLDQQIYELVYFFPIHRWYLGQFSLSKTAL